MAPKNPAYEEPNPELGSARDAAEASAKKDLSASPKPTDSAPIDKDKE